MLWFAASLFLGPLFVVVYLGGKNVKVLWALLPGGVSAALWLLLARHSHGPPRANFGTAFPIGTLLLLFVGFVVAVLWIALLAGELVALLEMWGAVLGLTPGFLGMTVLAFGNSMGDIVADLAAARMGRYSMAITACFGGPVFNLLVGLGLGYGVYLSTAGRWGSPVSLDPLVGFACGMLLLNAGLILAVAVAWGGRLPKGYSLAQFALYTLFAAAMVALEVRNHLH